MRAYLSPAQLEAKYSRLLANMRWAAMLSNGEALACLRDYRAGDKYSGEAVNHYGGTVAVVKAAASLRTNALYQSMRATLK
jgi:hypothetical protein